MIAHIIHPQQWRHVPTDLNPAYGLFPLLNFSTTTSGGLGHPGCIIRPCWTDLFSQQLLEAKEKVHITICDPLKAYTTYLRTSFLHHILRVTAWCKHYATNLDKEKRRLNEDLQLKETEQAEQTLFIHSHNQTFSAEIALLVAKKQLPTRTASMTYNPI